MNPVGIRLHRRLPVAMPPGDTLSRAAASLRSRATTTITDEAPECLAFELTAGPFQRRITSWRRRLADRGSIVAVTRPDGRVELQAEVRLSSVNLALAAGTCLAIQLLLLGLLRMEPNPITLGLFTLLPLVFGRSAARTVVADVLNDAVQLPTVRTENSATARPGPAASRTT